MSTDANDVAPASAEPSDNMPTPEVVNTSEHAQSAQEVASSDHVIDGDTSSPQPGDTTRYEMLL